MTNELIILSFPTIGGAQNFLKSLLPLQHEHLIQIEDLAFSVKQHDRKGHSSLLHQSALEVLLQGSLWGTLAGALFLEPFFGMLVGGTAALLLNCTRQNPELISRRLIRETTEKKLEPGSSALFLMVSRATPDKVMRRLHEHDATIISTSLSTDKERRLREAWKTIKTDGPLAQVPTPVNTARTQVLRERSRSKYELPR